MLIHLHCLYLFVSLYLSIDPSSTHLSVSLSFKLSLSISLGYSLTFIHTFPHSHSLTLPSTSFSHPISSFHKPHFFLIFLSVYISYVVISTFSTSSSSPLLLSLFYALHSSSLFLHNFSLVFLQFRLSFISKSFPFSLSLPFIFLSPCFLHRTLPLPSNDASLSYPFLLYCLSLLSLYQLHNLLFFSSVFLSM